MQMRNYLTDTEERAHDAVRAPLRFSALCFQQQCKFELRSITPAKVAGLEDVGYVDLLHELETLLPNNYCEQ